MRAREFVVVVRRLETRRDCALAAEHALVGPGHPVGERLVVDREDGDGEDGCFAELAQGLAVLALGVALHAQDARTLYEQLYCARGECENRIKEAQLDLFADRLSTATFPAPTSAVRAKAR